MSLYLTSDEITETNLNTRTSFSNYINQDFYKGNDFNLKLKELFFDTKFPTIANLGTPHAVTLISGHEHKFRHGSIRAKKSLFSKKICALLW